MEGTEGSSGRLCRAAPTEKKATTETEALNRHDGAGGGETPEVCSMAGAAHKCGKVKGVSNLV